VFDGYTCAATATALLIATARLRQSRAFVDPLELAGDVAELAGSAWLWHDMPRHEYAAAYHAAP
jgi:hypothetical protein